MTDPSTICLLSTTLCGPQSAAIVGGALASVSGIVDSAILIDTAPTGEGWAHEEGWGLDVFVVRWPWQGHFGEARQASLDFAADHGAAWSMAVDADERVVCPNPAAARAFLAALPAEVHVVVAMATDGSHGRERFFRHPMPHRWIGRTHEAFPVPTGAQASIPPHLITWSELPKDAAQLRAKSERDAALLAQEVAEHPDDARWLMYLGGALSGLDRNEEAIDAYHRAGQLGTGEDGAIACFRAAELLIVAEKWDEALAACARGMISHAAVAELPWLAGIASLRLGRAEQAAAWARLAIVHGEYGSGRDALESRVSFRSRRGLTSGPVDLLRVAEQTAGRAPVVLTPDPKPVHVTVTSTAVNAERCADRCVRSVREQSFARWEHHYFDAASDDDTAEVAAAAARRDPRCRVTRTATRRGLLANLLPTWRALPDDEVIVWLDGDDWLATDEALATVAAAHQAGALVTHGSFVTSAGQVCQWGPVRGAPRFAPWVSSHLKTFRAGLVKRILDADLRRADGAYLDLAIDQAIMLPVLEMAAERAVYIDRCLAVYNVGHSFSAGASPEDTAREHAEVVRIRAMRPYARATW